MGADKFDNNTNIWYLCKIKYQAMSKNTSITLGNYFDTFIKSQLNSGRYKNVSEIIRAGLRLLEEEENKIVVLKNAINEGVESGIAYDFDSELHLKEIKSKRK